MATPSTMQGDGTFLGISAELRNIIYELVLHHDRDIGQLANVKILRASRQIYVEAKGVLYSTAPLQISIDIENSSRTSRLEGDVRAIISGDSSLQDMALIWPPHIRQAKHLRFHLSFQRACFRDDDLPTINALLYTLSHHLAGIDSKVRTVSVHAYDVCPDRLSRNTPSNILKQAFYPLAKLQSTIELKLGGCLESLQGPIDRIREEEKNAKILSFNMLDHLTSTIDPFEILLQRAKFLSWSDATEEIIRKAYQFHMLQRACTSEYIDQSKDSRLRASTMMLQSAIEATPDLPKPEMRTPEYQVYPDEDVSELELYRKWRSDEECYRRWKAEVHAQQENEDEIDGDLDPLE